MNKKGQLSIGDAPAVVVIVGLTFLIMATMAFIGVKYGDATATETTGAVYNETLNASGSIQSLSVAALRNVDCVIGTVQNWTDGTDLPATNYTKADSTCQITLLGWNSQNVNVTFTYAYDLPSVATNVTDDLNTEIANNTSIAGIVLTVSLVGIVLTILIGIFVLARNKGI